jgi:hypothetical protein
MKRGQLKYICHIEMELHGTSVCSIFNDRLHISDYKASSGSIISE